MFKNEFKKKWFIFIYIYVEVNIELKKVNVKIKDLANKCLQDTLRIKKIEINDNFHVDKVAF